MKALILPLVVAGALMPPAPAGAEAPMTRDEARELCKRVAEVAEAVMEGRQAGVPMVKMMESLEGNAVYEDIVVDAYRKMRVPPEFPTMQRSAITDFQDEQYGECLRQLLPRH